MPRIPTVTGGRSESAPTGILSPGQVALPFRKIASDIDRFAVILGRVAAADQQAIDSLNKNRALIEGDEGLFQLRKIAFESEDFENAPRLYRENGTKLINSIASKISNPEHRTDVLFSLRRQMDSRGIAISRFSRARVTARRQADLIVLGASLAKSAASLDPKSDVDELALRADKEEYFEALETAQSEKLIDNAVVLKQQFLEDVDFNQAEEAAFNQNPFEAAASLRDRSQFTTLDPTERIRLGAVADRRAEEIEAAENAVVVKENELTISNLETRLDRKIGDPDSLEAEAQALFQRDVIGGPKLTQLRKLANDMREDFASSIASQQYVASVLAGAIPASPSSKMQVGHVSQFYDDVVVPAVEELSPEQRNEVKAEYATRMGVIPRKMKDEIIGGLRGSVDQVVSSAELIDRIGSVPGGSQLTGDIEDSDILLGKMVSIRIAAGTPPNIAVERSREAMTSRSPTRRADLSLILRGNPNAAFLTDHAAETGGFFGFFQTDTDIPDGLRDEFDVLVEGNFLRTGDIGVSRDVAFDTLKNVWGVSSVGEQTRWMKYAPEVMYPMFGGDSDEIQKQLLGDLASDGIVVEASDVRLVTDFRTAREIDPQTGRRRPTYAVGILNEFGEYEPLRDSETREPRRWRPDFFVTDMAIEAARERLEMLERSKEMRELLSTSLGGRVLMDRFSFQSKTFPPTRPGP